jgi:hypothetical protein
MADPPRDQVMELMRRRGTVELHEAQVQALAARLALADWDESKHPRNPKGSGPDGGKFASAAGGGAAGAGAGAGTAGTAEVPRPPFDAKARFDHVSAVLNSVGGTGGRLDMMTNPNIPPDANGHYTPYTEDNYPKEMDAQDRMVAKALIDRAIANGAKGAADNPDGVGHALMSGGMGGSGKTTLLTKDPTLKADGIAYTDYVPVNPDDAKLEMVRQGVIPTDPAIQDLNPMEMAPLLHERSSRIAGLVAQAAHEQGLNVMFDNVLANADKAQKKLAPFGDYTKTAIFADVPVEVSQARAASRFLNGATSYDAAAPVEGGAQGERATADPEHAFGGRYVPLGNMAASASSDERFQSNNRMQYERLIRMSNPDGSPMIDSHYTFNTNVPKGTPSILLDSGPAPTDTIDQHWGSGPLSSLVPVRRG